jgi:hypothetical protein
MNTHTARIVRLARWAVIISLILFLITASGGLLSKPVVPIGPVAGSPQTVYKYPLSVGVEYISNYPGTDHDLPCAANNAYGVYNTLKSSPWFWGSGSYIWGDANAWERDFKSNRAGGNKDSWADNVDLAFYEGHGNPTLFTFETATGGGTHDDSYLTYNDVNTRLWGLNGGGWGSKNLKWLGLLSCSVLADSHQNDWSYTMDGLHLLMGFATTAYDVCGFGQTFGQRVLAGNSIRDAWFIACDQKQPSGVQAKVLGEEYYDLYESIYSQMPGHPQDATYWVSTKWCGTRQPALYVNPQEVTAMPVLPTPPLSLAAAQNLWNGLGSTFGVPTQTAAMAPLALGDTWVSVSGTHQLEMDSANGLFYYVDNGALFSGTVAAKNGILAPLDAKAIADQFLTSNNLMSADAQFAEVLPVNLDTIQKPTGLNSPIAPKVINSTVTDYEVIYARIVTATNVGLTPAPTISYTVAGAGSKLKVYVTAAGGSARVSAPGQTGAVVGAQGGWRQVQSGKTLGPQQTTAVLPYPQVETLFQKMEPQVAYKNVPFDNPTSKTVLSYTLGYWEEAIGEKGQDQLYPAYIISATYSSITPTASVTGVSYMPIDSTFMPPLAKIQSTSDLSKNVRPGQVITLSAADASKTLAEVGIDPSLNFPLGTGPYLYTWYRDSIATGNEIPGTSNQKDITYTVTLSGTTVHGAPVSQSIYLVVKDAGSAHTSRNTSYAVVQANVMPPVYLPMLLKH